MSNPSEQFAEKYNKRTIRPIINRLIRQARAQAAAKAFDEVMARFAYLLTTRLGVTPDGAPHHVVYLGSTKKGLDIFCLEDCPNASQHLFQVRGYSKKNILMEPIKNPSINDLRNYLQMVDYTLEHLGDLTT